MTRILLLNPSFRLEQGGPAYSVGRLGVALANLGHQVTLWAADGTAAMAGAHDGAEAVTLSAAPMTSLLKARDWDIVHDNGLWLPHGARVARYCSALAIPRLLSIRGMMQPWAWNHRRWKKWFAWRLYQRRAVATASRLHATAQDEVDCIQARLPERRPVLIANGIDIPDQPPRVPKPAGSTRTALFLGRLHPVKGLPMLIEAWQIDPPPGWRLRLIGPDEEGFRARLSAKVQAAGLDDIITFSGPATGSAKAEAFADASLFILPSYTENFGISVAEALAHGLPVITTTGTPWPILQSKNCGWWVAPESAAIGTALAEATALPDARLVAMGAAGRDWVADHLHWPSIAKQFAQAYADAIANPIVI